jgi:ankyrin repeat protein
MAAAGGHQNIISLLEHRPSIIRSVIQNRILMSAALHGQEDVARTALDHGADPNAANFPLMKWSSVLEGASKKGYEGIVRLLLARGAKLRPRQRANPLIQAIRGGWLRIAQILIDHGAEVNPFPTIKDPNPLSPLLTAVEHGRAEMLQLLLENGANFGVNSCLSCEATTLAASHGHASIMRLLAEHGDEPMAKEEDHENLYESVYENVFDPRLLTQISPL